MIKMKTTSFAAASLLALASMATAQYQSLRFTLRTESEKAEYNNNLLTACHTGAGENSLCTGDTSTTADAYNIFYLNSTAPFSSVGSLVWQPPYSDGYTEVMSLDYTNRPYIEEAVFNIGDGPGTEVGFDDKNALYLAGAQEFGGWYLCDANILGYNYINLAWAEHGANLTAADCSPVTVIRDQVLI